MNKFITEGSKVEVLINGKWRKATIVNIYNMEQFNVRLSNRKVIFVSKENIKFN